MQNDHLNQEKNRLHYEEIYSRHSIKNTLYWLSNLDNYLDYTLNTETSWFGIYQYDLRNNLKGKKVLEMGAGDCLNAAVMAALGAEVYANDIASASGEIVNKLNKAYSFKCPITFIKGDFLNNELDSASFDLVIGKAFLHHLTLPVEVEFLKETARLLKENGEARFFEPAVNNRLVDSIRWHLPTKGRPSKFKKKAFAKWKLEDPHPDRTYSSKHFEKAGKPFFKNVEIIPVGTLERFGKLLPINKKQARFRQWAYKMERKLPRSLNLSLTRSQTIIYSQPIKGEQ